jgi:hypothetical protein
MLFSHVSKKKTALHPTQNRPVRALDTKWFLNCHAPANGFESVESNFSTPIF